MILVLFSLSLSQLCIPLFYDLLQCFLATNMYVCVCRERGGLGGPFKYIPQSILFRFSCTIFILLLLFTTSFPPLTRISQHHSFTHKYTLIPDVLFLSLIPLLFLVFIPLQTEILHNLKHHEFLPSKLHSCLQSFLVSL